MTDVWFCNVVNNVDLVKLMTASLGVDDWDFAVAAEKANHAGAALGAGHFSKQVWADKHVRTRLKLHPIFFGNGEYIVNEAAAQVLRLHDMGAGALYPVEVLERDRKTPARGGPWFCWNFGNVKHAIVVEECRGLRPNPFYRQQRRLPPDVEDDDIAVSAAALRGPDVWVDPALNDTLFVSGRLGAALHEVELDGAFRLRRCRVVEG